MALSHQDFHGQMPEPTCDRLFDFDFERRTAADQHGEMTEAEVRRLMFAEVCSYRPCAEGKSGNVSRWGTNLGAKGGAGPADAKGQSDAGNNSGAFSPFAAASFGFSLAFCVPFLFCS